MEITIKATPEEVKELIQDIASSKEQIDIQTIFGERSSNAFPEKEKTIQREEDSLKEISASNIDTGDIKFIPKIPTH